MLISKHGWPVHTAWVCLPTPGCPSVLSAFPFSGVECNISALLQQSLFSIVVVCLFNGPGVISLLLKAIWICWNRAWQPTPVFLPGKSHWQRNLAGYSSWGCKESDRTEWLTWIWIYGSGGQRFNADLYRSFYSVSYIAHAQNWMRLWYSESLDQSHSYLANLVQFWNQKK